MKKYNHSILRLPQIIFTILIPFLLQSRTIPYGLNFQTIVRESNGKPVANKNVNIRFSILKSSSSGPILYSEEHRTISNEFGLVNVLIGYGFPTSGKFDQIKWEESSTYLKTEIDPNGGINYELSGITPFLSVPYALYAAKTYLEAGPGIQINGSRITNTGDLDPNDDLHNGSIMSGDLGGVLPNPKVVALQGLPISSILPAINQALIWNGSQWQGVAVDNDPSNDITNSTVATGDLSGSYPSPSVIKLNGIPLSISKPDSGDVLIYSQNEWKHLPIGNTSQGSSYWKKSGAELVLEDPINVKTINLQTSGLTTQNRLLNYKLTDSIYVDPIGISLTKGVGNSKLKHIINPDYLGISLKNTPLLEIEPWAGLGSYMSIDLYQLDTSYRERWAYLDPNELHFRLDRPNRDAGFSGSEFYMYRTTKISPLELSGIDIVDSTIVMFQGSNDIFAVDRRTGYGCGLFTYDKNGKDRFHFSSLLADQSQAYLGMWCSKTNRNTHELLSTNNAGEFFLYNSNTDQLNVYAGYTNVGPVYPFLGIGDAAGADAAGMYLNNFGQGVIFADVKNFRMKDPENASKEIWYASIEGPEAAAYERGSAKIVNGEFYVYYSEHFKKVANTQKVTVQLTPNNADTYGLAVIEKNSDGFKVKELQNGKGSYVFDWEVKAVRKGYENYQVVREHENISAANIHQKSFEPSHESNIQSRLKAKIKKDIRR